MSATGAALCAQPGDPQWLARLEAAFKFKLFNFEQVEIKLEVAVTVVDFSQAHRLRIGCGSPVGRLFQLETLSMAPSKPPLVLMEAAPKVTLGCSLACNRDPAGPSLVA